MTNTNRLRLGATLALLSLGARVGGAQQDGLVMLPETYRIQFENAWVRLVRVTLAGNAQLPDHSHPPGTMLHVYFNDAGPVKFAHDGPPGDIVRPSVTARSYRTGRATPEVHAVVNTSPMMSDYMRVELKTRGDNAQRQRIAGPPLTNETKAVVEVQNPQYRVTRVTVAANQSTTIATTASEPAVLLALTSGVAIVDDAGKSGDPMKVGQERFVSVGRNETIRNATSAPAQVLRVDFLTPPIVSPPR